MKKTYCRKMISKSAFLIILLCCKVWAALNYSITNLGSIDMSSSCATSINDAGHIVGTYIMNGNMHGFSYDNHVMSELGQNVVPFSINNIGQIACKIGQEAYLLDTGVFTSIGNAYPFDINDLSQIAGASQGIFVSNFKATLWNEGLVTELDTFFDDPGPSFATAINNDGQVVGYSHGSGVITAFLWKNGTISNIAGPRTTAEDINNVGQITGTHYVGDLNSSGDEIQHVYLWNNGAITDLGQGYSAAINDSGIIVGHSIEEDYSDRSALVWRNGISYKLEDLIVDGFIWDRLLDAQDINNFGQIVGTGIINGQTHAFLLTPIPEPATLGLLLVGSGLILNRKSRASI